MSKGKTCPIISLTSELKSWNDYPECHEKCAWYDEQDDCCIVVALMQSVKQYDPDESLRHDVGEMLKALSPVLDRIGTRMRGF